MRDFIRDAILVIGIWILLAFVLNKIGEAYLRRKDKNYD